MNENDLPGGWDGKNRGNSMCKTREVWGGMMWSGNCKVRHLIHMKFKVPEEGMSERGGD